MGSEFKKTLRTVHLGFYRHEGCDPIVNVSAPRFAENTPSRMPSHDTLDFMSECPRLFPCRGDITLESLARDVVTDLFWMCCCRAAATTAVMPANRRAGAQCLLETIRRCVFSAIPSDRDVAMSGACSRVQIEDIGKELGAIPNNVEVEQLVMVLAEGGREALANAMWEPNLGDCEVRGLLREGKRFSDRAALGMHFLASGCSHRKASQDILISHLVEACRRLIVLAEPESRFAEKSVAWVRELLMGIPSDPTAGSGGSGALTKYTHQRLAPAPPNFGVRRSIHIPYERPSPTIEEEMFRAAICKNDAPRKKLLLASSERGMSDSAKGFGTNWCSQGKEHACYRCAPEGVSMEQSVFPRVELRLGSCTPALQSWTDSPRIRSGRHSRRLQLTTPLSNRTEVSHTEFARKCTPVFHTARPPPRVTHSSRSLDDKQGRREMMQRERAIRLTKSLADSALQALRVSMRDTLGSLDGDERSVAVTEMALMDLEALKTKLDDLFSNNDFMRSLSAVDRADVRDRSVFLAKIIGAQRRMLQKQRTVDTIWEENVTSDEKAGKDGQYAKVM